MAVERGRIGASQGAELRLCNFDFVERLRLSDIYDYTPRRRVDNGCANLTFDLKITLYSLVGDDFPSIFLLKAQSD